MKSKRSPDDSSATLVALARAGQDQELRVLAQHLLDAGDDLAVKQAFWVLHTEHQRTALVTLGYALDEAITVDVRRHRRCGNASLFLVPVIIVSDHTLPMELPESVVHAATQALWDHDLARDHTITALFRGLYALTDLPGTPSQWRQMTKRALTRGPMAPPKGLPSSGGRSLRFLAGITASWAGVEDAGPLEDGCYRIRPDEDIDGTLDEIADQTEAWCATLSTLLKATLHARQVEARWPGHPLMAIREGIQCERDGTTEATEVINETTH